MTTTSSPSSEVELNDIRLRAALSTRVICPKCQGALNIRSEDGSLKPCICVVRDQFIQYLAYLRRFATLPTTPLLDMLKRKGAVELVVECDRMEVFFSHLKTALLKRKDASRKWVILSPEEVMSRSFSPDASLKRTVYETDLLVITAPVFPYYEAAAKQHEYVMQMRLANAKHTIFVTKSLGGMMNAKGMIWPDSFRNMLNNMGKVKLDSKETIMMAKQAKAASGAKPRLLTPGMSGLNMKMQLADPPVSLPK